MTKYRIKFMYEVLKFEVKRFDCCYHITCDNCIDNCYQQSFVCNTNNERGLINV